MFNQLLVYLTVQTLFGWLDSDDLRMVSSHWLAGDITGDEKRELLDIFVPLAQKIV